MAKLYNEFNNWFHELEGFGTRAERCYSEYDTLKYTEPLKNLRQWLEAAFLAGRMETRYTLQVEEDDAGNALITFPPELLAQYGWQEGTTLVWTDNHDGSWTLKDKT